jgi:hypothetical protein
MKHTEMTQLYSSPNGDTWFLVGDPATGTAFVQHKANPLSGGQVTDIPIATFLSWSRSPEQEALLSLLGTQVADALNAEADNASTAVSSDREWSDTELSELEDLLMCEVSIKEIARLLQRDHDDVQNKVVEIGRACR